MTLGLIFWIVYVIGLIFYINRTYGDRTIVTHNIIYWILTAILGIGIFGSPIK